VILIAVVAVAVVEPVVVAVELVAVVKNIDSMMEHCRLVLESLA
jgi:hypothetical protein